MDASYTVNICLFTANDKTQSICFNYFTSLFESHPELKAQNASSDDKFETASFSFQNINLVFYSQKQIKAVKEDNLDTEELVLPLNEYLKEHYHFQIDYLLAVYSEAIHKQIKLLTKKWDKNVFLIFPMDSKEYSTHPYANKFQMRDPKILPSLLQSIKENCLWKDEYNVFNDYSKEHYYETLGLYSKRREELAKMTKAEQMGLFNSFEKFSFDYDYCSDDSIILLQIFTSEKNKLRFDLKINRCNKCQSQQTICAYEDQLMMYLCENCIMRLNQTAVMQCAKCATQFPRNMNEGYVVTFCCRSCYCIKCLKEQITVNEEKALEQRNLSLITCFCGNSIDSLVIQSLLGDFSFQSFKFESKPVYHS